LFGLKDIFFDMGASRLCLSADAIEQLGIPFQEEVDVKLAVGIRKVRVFRDLNLQVNGREGGF
jgi:hypothetical protein